MPLYLYTSLTYRVYPSREVHLPFSFLRRMSLLLLFYDRRSLYLYFLSVSSSFSYLLQYISPFCQDAYLTVITIPFTYCLTIWHQQATMIEPCQTSTRDTILCFLNFFVIMATRECVTAYTYRYCNK